VSKLACALLLLALIFAHSLLQANPWGKDADLCEMKSRKETSSSSGSLAESLIRFHQDVISPADGPRSHFLPSSSQYTLDAMRKYGFFKGFLLGCDRLMRENSEPWVYRKMPNSRGQVMKYDPVR
jgi:putative component of membrane protein insertase Oxa1/YidC/SpoIIIJ protein YidD